MTVSKLVEAAQRSIEQFTLELSGEEDFMPFVTIRDPRGEFIYMGLVMRDGAEEHDAVGDTICAACIIHRAVEVTFASAAWMVMTNKDVTVKVSEHPDRQEVVQLCSVTQNPDDDVMYMANLVRENGKVGIGLWDESGGGSALDGRFVRAMRSGLEMAQKIPPEMADFLDANTGDPERLNDLIQRTVNTVGMIRKGMTP